MSLVVVESLFLECLGFIALLAVLAVEAGTFVNGLFMTFPVLRLTEGGFAAVEPTRIDGLGDCAEAVVVVLAFGASVATLFLDLSACWVDLVVLDLLECGR